MVSPPPVRRAERPRPIGDTWGPAPQTWARWAEEEGGEAMARGASPPVSASRASTSPKDAGLFSGLLKKLHFLPDACEIAATKLTSKRVQEVHQLFN